MSNAMLCCTIIWRLLFNVHMTKSEIIEMIDCFRIGSFKPKLKNLRTVISLPWSNWHVIEFIIQNLFMRLNKKICSSCHFELYNVMKITLNYLGEQNDSENNYIKNGKRYIIYIELFYYSSITANHISLFC